MSVTSEESAPVVVSRDGAVATVTINRPDARNAVNLPTVQMLASVLAELEQDLRVRALVITGAGEAFCAGADLADRVASLGDADRDARMMAAVTDVMGRLLKSRLPIVAAVVGPAAGVGASIAFASDLVVAAHDASFLLPFTGIGLIPDGGATATVAASIGRARALRLALRRERVAGDDAYQWGLIAEVRPADEVLETAASIAVELSQAPAASLASTKRLINLSALGDGDDLLGRERVQQLSLMGQPDFREGVLSFVERRKPVFSKASM